MRKKRKQKKRRLKIMPLISLIVIVLFIGTFIHTYRADPFNIKDDSNGWTNPLQSLKNRNERINILVFGVDSLNNEKSNNSRSDSIMLVTIDPNKENPSIISIPRDTRVEIPGRKNFDKINHAHAYGGPELLVKTVEKLLDLDINYYVRINYNVVIDVVDALGGIEIDVPIDMRYRDPYATPPLNINIKKGLQVLDGEQSVHFMRFRKGYVNQDLGRIEAQQQFVKALIDKVLSPSTILKIPQLIDIAYSNIDTNMTKTNMVSLAVKGSTMDTQNLNKITLEGTPKTINGISYYVVTENSISDLKENYLNDDKDATYKAEVEVLNGCGISGIAGEYGSTVEEYGFKIYKVDNYEKSTVDISFIEYEKPYKNEAEIIQKKLGVDKLIEKNIGEANIRIIVGKDLAE